MMLWNNMIRGGLLPPGVGFPVCLPWHDVDDSAYGADSQPLSLPGRLRRRVREMDFDLSLPSGRIRARRWGPNGAPLLLCIHGLSANHLAFAYLAECIAGDNRQVVSIDLRGRGRSTVTPPGSYGLSSHARDVIDVADALGAADFDIVGWSLGAMIAMKVAQREGARLRSVVPRGVVGGLRNHRGDEGKAVGGEGGTDELVGGGGNDSPGAGS